MLELFERKCKLRSANNKREIHGDTSVLAIYLSFEWIAPNTELERLGRGLLAALYRKGELPVEDLPGIDAKLTALKFPTLSVLTFEDAHEHMLFTIHQGGPGHDLILDECLVDCVSIGPKDGGTSTVRFRVRTHPKDSKTAGMLCNLLVNGDITVSVAAMESEAA
jgi:hypothetical protein